MKPDNNWIAWEWTAEKPYPETLVTKVKVKWSDGDDDERIWLVSDWLLAFDNPNLEEVYITHYRLADSD